MLSNVIVLLVEPTNQSNCVQHRSTGMRTTAYSYVTSLDEVSKQQNNLTYRHRLNSDYAFGCIDSRSLNGPKSRDNEIDKIVR